MEFKKEVVLGKILAHGIGMEEQERTSLSGHIILCVQGEGVLQQQLFLWLVLEEIWQSGCWENILTWSYPQHWHHFR